MPQLVAERVFPQTRFDFWVVQPTGAEEESLHEEQTEGAPFRQHTQFHSATSPAMAVSDKSPVSFRLVDPGTGLAGAILSRMSPMPIEAAPHDLSNAFRPHDDRRREPRFDHEFSIEVSGFDHAGRFFTERTWTLDASPCGCRFTARCAVERGSVIAIRLLDVPATSVIDRATVLFQVAHVEQASRGWTVGVWRLQSSKAWTAKFDAASRPSDTNS